MSKKNSLALVIIFFHFFLIGQNNCVRVDTIKYSKNTVFLCKWYRFVGNEIFNPNGEKFIKDTDTAYDCDIYVIKLKDKTKNNFKCIMIDRSVAFLNKYYFKLYDSFTLPCFSDTSSINGIIRAPGWITNQVKFKQKRGKCKKEE